MHSQLVLSALLVAPLPQRVQTLLPGLEVTLPFGHGKQSSSDFPIFSNLKVPGGQGLIVDVPVPAGQ